MSSVSDGGHHNEIIIVKHGGGDHEEGHHGGAWKIAFADFMTALMCFFLVMWLINAANEQTKSAVASYFNPVKLIDRNSSRRGLEEVGEGPNTISGSNDQKPKPNPGAGSEGTQTGSSEGTKEGKATDQQMFADPYAVLAEIAASTDTQQNVSEKGDGGAQSAGPATGASGGESYRDPFAPDFWSQQVETVEDPGEKPVEADTRSAGQELRPAKEGAKPQEMPAEASIPETRPEPQAESKPPVEEQAKVEEKPEPEAKPEPEVKPGEPTAAQKAEAKAVEQEIADAVGNDKISNGIEVKATSEGVEISVTEELEFGMFQIGSAVPRRELVLAMEKIGRILGERQGDITIKGHTDARPFKNAQYDNWRLSTARAQSAYYMIARSGLDEKRIKEVSGFADRELKNPADPMAAENRRIEILLKSKE